MSSRRLPTSEPRVVGEAIWRWVAPPQLGDRFPKLIGYMWLSNLGDGVLLAAGPLLIASQTRSPSSVALATVLQRLPWVLFGLMAGVVADRVNRRLLLVVGQASRIMVLAAIVASIATGTVNVGVVLAAMFVLGVAETFTDISIDAVTPLVVPRDGLGVANARLLFGHRTLNLLVGPPLGAVLFAVGMVLPFMTQAMLLALALVVIAGLRVPDVNRSDSVSVRAEVTAGIRWLWDDAPIRTLALTVFTFNLTFGAFQAMLVLYSAEQLGLDEASYGLLLGAGAVGGVVGTLFFDRLHPRFSLADLMRAALITETLSHLGLAMTTSAAVAFAIMFAMGVEMAVWGTVSQTIRQATVPPEYQGRVASVYRLGIHGGLIIGGLAGGVIGSASGLVSVYLFAFFGSALILILLWRRLGQIVLTDPRPEPG